MDAHDIRARERAWTKLVISRWRKGLSNRYCACVTVAFIALFSVLLYIF